MLWKVISGHIMLTAGNQWPYKPQFFSLDDKTRPLPACLKGTKDKWDKGYSIRYGAALFPGKGRQNKNGTWSSSEGKSQGTAWETNLWLIFFTDKRPLLCGGYSTPDDQRCIQYDAPRDAWYFNTSSLMGRWVNKMHYLLLWQNLLINKNLSKSPFE